jgi:quercetin dioxygenase-like cupin family protein
MLPAAAQTLFQSALNSTGQIIAYPREGTPEVTAFLAEMAPGEETGWHSHPVPLLGYLFEGQLSVVQVTGEKRIVRAGEVSLESVGVVHNGVNEGTVPCKMIVFVVGLKDVPFTIAAEHIPTLSETA